MGIIEYENVCKRFDNMQGYAVDNVSLKIKRGEFVTILGSSGCGKTTLLKLTNRLYEPDAGRILIDSRDIAENDPVKLRRSIGYVIQQVGLFPHMTVEDNIMAIPAIEKWERNRMRARADELLELVGLLPAEFRDRYPHQLSGGQQQRVGLARALATDPEIMLLDEPFGAIDAITRLGLQNELLSIHAELNKTFLLVTHDINEAFKLADRTIIMNQGRVIQFDTPYNIVTRPADDFVNMLIDSARSEEGFWEAIK